MCKENGVGTHGHATGAAERRGAFAGRKTSVSDFVTAEGVRILSSDHRAETSFFGLTAG